MYKRFVCLLAMTVMIGCSPSSPAHDSGPTSAPDGALERDGVAGADVRGDGASAQSARPYREVVASHRGFQVDALTRAYRAILQREPDDGGLASHAQTIARDGIDGWVKTLRTIATSDEFKNNVRPAKSDLEILGALYEGLLGPNRAIDPQHQAAQLAQINAGRVADVALALGDSDAFYGKVYPFAPLDADRASAAVKRAYLGLLGRDADAAGLQTYVADLLDDNMRGWYGVLVKLSSSAEHRALAATKSATELVTQLYQGLLDRDVAAADGGAAAQLVAAGRIEEAAFLIATSDEFMGKLGVGKRRGLVRLNGRTLFDDSGELNALGATLFSAARWYKLDRKRLERQLDTLARNGFDYIRALGTVAWAGREIDPKWVDYRQVIEGVTDLAYDKYGLRVQWTIFGDAQLTAPSDSERRAIVQMFLDISTTRQEKIILFEIANEYWQNGFSGSAGETLLRELARYLDDRTPILVATSAAGSDCSALNGAGITDVGIQHFDRDVSQVDGAWRPVGQPWSYQFCNGPVAGSNNEPIGPGSSVACESDPLRLVMAAVATYNAGLPFYVFHSRAGVGMGSRCGLDGDQDLAQMPGIDAFKAMKAYMPAGSSGWDRHAHTSSSNPLILYGDGKALRTTTDGAQSGCMANLASTKGNAFVAALIGCKGTVTLEARYDASFKVLDPLSGAVLQTRALTKGQSFGLSGLAAYVIKGTTSGTTSTAACTGSPLSILQCHRSKYGTPMTDAEMLAVVRDSARDFNSASVPGGPYGILKKATGNNCAGYSCDIICAGQGSSQQQWDVLVASNTPTWGSPLPGPLRIDVCEIQ